MITAHLPAGYLTGRAMAPSGLVLWAAVLGGILPDLDLIWFYLIDNRAFHHHRYWVHIPGFWAMVATLCLPLARYVAPRWFWPTLAFFAAIFIHLCLDSISGGIAWLWPVSGTLFYLIEVPARQNHWVLNFILHPVFLLEILIWLIALWLYLREPSSRKSEG